MGDFDAKDPVQLALEKITATLAAFAPLTGDAALVKVGLGSILDYTTASIADPRKPRAQTADWPILDVVPTEFEDSTPSGRYHINQVFELTIDTGDLTVSKLLWVVWQVRRALWQLRHRTGTGYSWMPTLHFRSAANMIEALRKRPGWVAIAQIEVVLNIPRTDMET